MRVVFMGTPDFAVPTLRTLVEHAPPGLLWAGGLDIVGVITRPDKPSGRGRQTTLSPIKQFALECGVPVHQPGSLRQPETLRLLRVLAPDVIIVVAFGQILPPDVLDLPKYGCLNVHGSLLPRFRGASPVAGAILAGDHETGTSIILMDEGLDTGPVLARKAIAIQPGETAGELADRLAVLGATLLARTLPRWLARGIAPEAQDESQATMTQLLRKEDGRLDWHQPAERLERAVCAYTPWPGAFTTWDGQQLKVLRAHALEDAQGHAPGECFVVMDGHEAVLAVACEQSALALEVIQLEGKRALPSHEVLRGHPTLASATLAT
ncbi:MAG: methionyl-tRNA formyltransferase [Ktedonobacterales bacterium]|nr:methionyl-tRNA formyltransferase [Ktedonobacterales bacterium]